MSVTAHRLLAVAVTFAAAGCTTTLPQAAVPTATPVASATPATQTPVDATAAPAPTDAALPDRVRLASHLEAIARITDESGGTRAAGSAAYDQAVTYTADVLATAGYSVTIEPFEIDGVASSNVVAETPLGGERVVMLGAHLDSVEAGPGINDNASGVAALLTVAERVATLPALHNTVRFGFWGAEEGGPSGSRAYVDRLDAEAREAVVAYLNFDMLASPNAIRFVYDEPAAAPGSRQLTQLFASYFEAAGQAWAPIDLHGGSDHGPFRAAGIPSGGLFSGGIEPVTDEQAATFDAVAGEPADACSHRACDTIDNVDLVTLEEMTRAIWAVVIELAVEP